MPLHNYAFAESGGLEQRETLISVASENEILFHTYVQR